MTPDPSASAGGGTASGVSAGEPILIPQPHGGVLQRGGRAGKNGGNQHTVAERAEQVRGKLLTQLERVTDHLGRQLEAAENAAGEEGGRPRCTACGSFIPGAFSLKLPEVLAVIRELRHVLPAQHEFRGALANLDLSRLTDDQLSRLSAGDFTVIGEVFGVGALAPGRDAVPEATPPARRA